eukprot:964468-Prorocentrum_minimum.AAC.3
MQMIGWVRKPSRQNRVWSQLFVLTMQQAVKQSHAKSIDIHLVVALLELLKNLECASNGVNSPFNIPWGPVPHRLGSLPPSGPKVPSWPLAIGYRMNWKRTYGNSLQVTPNYKNWVSNVAHR